MSQHWLNDPEISDRTKILYRDVSDAELSPDGSPEYDFNRELEHELEKLGSAGTYDLDPSGHRS